MPSYPSSYEWQGFTSPTQSSNSGSHHSSARAAPSSQIDPFHGAYPNAPHLRPIELPAMESPAPATLPGFASPGHHGPGSSSSRSRPVSLPPQSNGTGLGIYGMPSPPSSPSSAPAVHPLLRGSADGSVMLLYNVLFAPTVRGSRAVRLASGARIGEYDLSLAATNPPAAALRVTLLTYAGGPGSAPQRFPWVVTLAASRRTSAPAPGQPSSPLSLGDVLSSLHLSLLVPVTDAELLQFSSQQQQYAHALRAARLSANPSTPATLVRADFLCGCTELAGFVRNADNSFTVRMAPRV
ncbi:hypothetical protein M0805_008192 [Coniferiporia weirii]|nr:hypothetical protein M0805_008192 [Coniferiporia weirii]